MWVGYSAEGRGEEQWRRRGDTRQAPNSWDEAGETGSKGAKGQAGEGACAASMSRTQGQAGGRTSPASPSHKNAAGAARRTADDAPRVRCGTCQDKPGGSESGEVATTLTPAPQHPAACQRAFPPRCARPPGFLCGLADGLLLAGWRLRPASPGASFPEAARPSPTCRPTALLSRSSPPSPAQAPELPGEMETYPPTARIRKRPAGPRHVACATAPPQMPWTRGEAAMLGRVGWSLGGCGALAEFCAPT